MLAFGYELQNLIKAIAKDLRERKLDKEKVTAMALDIMEETPIRAGNNQYRKAYNSFRLTTLRNKHVKINGQLIFFKFVRKKEQEHQIKVSDRSLAKKLKAVMEHVGFQVFSRAAVFSNESCMNILLNLYDYVHPVYVIEALTKTL